MSGRTASLSGLAMAGAIVGCAVTVSDRGVQNVPGEEIWKTEVEMLVGETAYVDRDELEMTLQAVGLEEARVRILTRGRREERVVRTGLAGAARVPPYEIRLLSTGVDESARFEVRREWGPRPR